MASKLHQPAPLLCYPYGNRNLEEVYNTSKLFILFEGVSITCVCDPQGAIFNCFPTNYKRVAQFGELNKRNSINKAEMDQDEKVEIILASTALVAVIALFLRWRSNDIYILLSGDFWSVPNHYDISISSFLMYKVEKYFNKNEYQVLFLADHLLPSHSNYIQYKVFDNL